jgi:tetratricopeptide (TPR) repeat protein
VDALVFGEVTTYRVEPDQRGVEKVRNKVGTGRYEIVDQKNVLTGKTKKVKKEIMRTVLVDEHYSIRRGTVAINFRVVGVETGELLAVHSDSKSYTSGKVKEGSYKTLKPQGEILSELSQTICQHFVRLIAPYHALEYRKLESGKGSIKTGKNYAMAGLWKEALETWKISIVEMPGEPAAYYNLGVAYEVQGMLDEAETAYKTAVLLKQKRLYMDALARIRQSKKEQEILQEQLKDRQDSQE